MSNKLEIEYVPIDRLKPFKGNPRQNNGTIESIVKSIKAFGYTNPILARRANGEIIAGHARLKALQAIGQKEAPVVFLDLDETDARVYSIFDNKSVENADWDLPKLVDMFVDLDQIDVDLDLTGFSTEEIADIAPATFEAQAEDDAVPEPPAEPISKTGDLWLLGEHRLLCGDSTKAEDVERLMDGKKADMVFTDPPYGMNLDTDFSDMKGIGVGKKYEQVRGDDKGYDPSHLFKDFGYCPEIFLWGADYYAEKVPNRNDGSWIVWDKTEGGISPNSAYDKMFGSNFELCWSRQKHKRALARVLWKGIFGLAKEDTKSRIHPTQKPVLLIKWFFEKFKGGLVIDLFLGSGSTLIACEKTGRKCFGMEIDPIYCDVIVKRWEDYTGKKAELANG